MKEKLNEMIQPYVQLLAAYNDTAFIVGMLIDLTPAEIKEYLASHEALRNKVNEL